VFVTAWTHADCAPALGALAEEATLMRVADVGVVTSRGRERMMRWVGW
jgi:hypothetical protein